MSQRHYQPGTTVAGHYTITGLLGSGGSAGVYRARDTVMNRTVAIKILSEEAGGTALRNFMTEARAAAVLSHPNIVNVYDVLDLSGEKYIIMEYVCGITLREYLDHHGHLSVKESVNCAHQVLHALHAAHSRGIIHRDIKPGNILITTDGRIKVTDFGIARLPDGDSFLMPDRTVGTVHYVSPEQAGGGAVDERSDLYSLGVVLYEMLTGRRPFVAERPADVAMMQISARPEPPSYRNPHVPLALEKIVLCAMEKDPASRFDSAAEMIRMLDRLPDDVLSGRVRPLREEASAYRRAAERFDERTAPLPKLWLSRRNMPKKDAPRGRVELVEDVDRIEEVAPAPATPQKGEAPAAPPPPPVAPVPPMPAPKGNLLDVFTAEDTVDIMLSPTGQERVEQPSPESYHEEPLILERRREAPLAESVSEPLPDEETAIFTPAAERLADAPREEGEDKKKKPHTPRITEETRVYRLFALVGALVLAVILLVAIVRNLADDGEPEPESDTTVAHAAEAAPQEEDRYAV